MKQGTFIYIRLYFEYEGMDTKVPRYEGTYIEVVWSDVKWCEELYIDT